MIDGKTSQAFSAVTLAPPEKKLSYKEEIIEISREKYGRPRKEVEKEILFRGLSATESQIRQRGLFT